MYLGLYMHLGNFSWTLTLILSSACLLTTFHFYIRFLYELCDFNFLVNSNFCEGLILDISEAFLNFFHKIQLVSFIGTPLALQPYITHTLFCSFAFTTFFFLKKKTHLKHFSPCFVFTWVTVLFIYEVQVYFLASKAPSTCYRHGAIN